MFRHVVLLTLRSDAGESARDAIVDALRGLPPQIPELVDYRVGVDAGLAADNATIGVIAEFEDRAGYEVYRDHPAHVAVIEQLIRPHLAGRSAIQMAT